MEENAVRLVDDLVGGGMPISAIADATRIARGTIYAWLRGDTPPAIGASRLIRVHALMTGVANVAPRDIYRFWDTPVAGETTLGELMMADDLFAPATVDAVQGLRKEALRAAASEHKMSIGKQADGNPILDAIHEVVANP